MTDDKSQGIVCPLFVSDDVVEMEAVGNSCEVGGQKVEQGLN